MRRGYSVDLSKVRTGQFWVHVGKVMGRGLFYRPVGLVCKIGELDRSVAK